LWTWLNEKSLWRSIKEEYKFYSYGDAMLII
jgi:S-adenosylmethionine:tRNA-ribosyltransferase-isomerase (queuine synthetase)